MQTGSTLMAATVQISDLQGIQWSRTSYSGSNCGSVSGRVCRAHGCADRRRSQLFDEQGAIRVRGGHRSVGRTDVATGDD